MDLTTTYPSEFVQAKSEPILPDRWHPLRYHKTQQAYLHSRKRFNIVPAGRRSGKTEIGKRRCVRKALLSTQVDANVIISAPTFAQAKRIYWKDVKKLCPRGLIISVSESELTIGLVNGASIIVTGLDKPERVEGIPIDHVLLDEYGNMKKQVWSEHIRPGLADHLGSADFIGVPEGRNHYYDLWLDAQEDREWGCFHWSASDILPKSEIEAAKRDLDPLTYSQEFDAHFVTFQGLAYYQFSRDLHVGPVVYDPTRVLLFCFDFNAAPGVAVIAQEYPDWTAIVGEVHIPQNSTTPKVCRKLIEKYKGHEGKILAYGDATGGAKGSAKVEGSDWDLIRQYLKPTFPGLRFEVPSANPKERSRVNAVNSRLLSASSRVGVKIDPSCKYLIRDFEGVTVQEGTAGELDKSEGTLTHLTDAFGYYVVRRWPVRKKVISSTTY